MIQSNQPTNTKNDDWACLLEQWRTENAAEEDKLRRQYLLWGALAHMLAFWASWALLQNIIPYIVVAIYGSGMYWMFCANALKNRAWQRYETLAQQLAETEDLRAVGPILELHWSATASMLEMPLTRLLPRLRRSDADLLTEKQKTFLYDALKRQTSVHTIPFALACLDAIENIGDTCALPTLAYAIMRDAPTAKRQAIRSRTRECLATLMERLDFDTVEAIPDWIAKLPYKPHPDSLYQVPGTWDDALTAIFALTHLLPQLRPQDTHLLSSNARKRLGEAWSGLYAAFVTSSGSVMLGGEHYRLGPDFKLAMLDAFHQIGTGQDIQYVRTQAYGDAPTDDVRRIRERAREVLTVLKERREREREGETLLRGASAPPASPVTLLRPANGLSGDASVNAAELLRAQAAPAPRVIGAWETQTPTEQSITSSISSEP